MAVVVESVSSAAINGSSGTSLTITKPTGLAVGDLMICFLGGPNDWNINTATNWNGLTQAQSTEGNQLTSKAQWKIADSADVAASNFTFTISTSSGFTGYILRISGHDATTPINAQSNVNSDSDTSTPSIANTITPSVANCLIICAWWESDNQNSFSNYAIATSSPSFTPQTDASGTVAGTGRGMSRACATGTRSQTTATGNASVTFGATGQRFNAAQIAVAPAAPSGPTNLKSLDTNVKSNIKRYNTNPIANIKSINTNA